MIESVKLVDFLSHKDTQITLGDDTSVFVGSNGAGKSSVVDAITFALFGKHTRKINRQLIRRGANAATVQVIFTVDSSRYMATRTIGSRGDVGSALKVYDGGDWKPVITGERRGFGESMTRRIEEILGMDYEKMQIAGIVQQGELVSIVEEKPKKFKETLNDIIGIERLDAAALLMGDAVKEFRASIRGRVGYDDLAIPQLESEYTACVHDKKRLESVVMGHEKKMSIALKQNALLKSQLESGREKLEAATELGAREDELVRYVKDAIKEKQQSLDVDMKTISECTKHLLVCKDAHGANGKLEELIQKINAQQKSLQDVKFTLAGLEEKTRLATSLHLTDGRCPVCDSKVDSLKPIYDEAKLDLQINATKSQILQSQGVLELLEKEHTKVLEVLDLERRAKMDLARYDIGDENQLHILQQSIAERKMVLEKLPQYTMLQASSLGAEVVIDDRSRQLFSAIEQLRIKVAGFNGDEFKKIQQQLEDGERQMMMIQSDLGANHEALKRTQSQMQVKSEALTELQFVSAFVTDLERIRDTVFSRDGHVATSLRSWALQSISEKATAYMDMFDTKVQRIQLEEKKKDFTINCYSGITELDIKSLSGGERVCVALAMRLGMAAAFGASRLNFVILDEPTAYLDNEKKSALVKAITQRENGPQIQLVIISHDREIFENTAVENVYSFESDGSLPDSPTVVTSN